MNRLSGQKLSLGQENGNEVELIVDGDNEYATYETLDGHSVVYDDPLGLFCYAQLTAGRFESTQVPVAEPPPPLCLCHGRESDQVRRQKVEQARLKREARTIVRPLMKSEDVQEAT